MFIAIDAKADIKDSKKGKITPEQHSQFNAFLLSPKTGILDIEYTDGSHALCEATQTSYTVPTGSNSINITFHKGYISICGRLVECEEGTNVPISIPTTGTVEGWIILRYNLTASGVGEFEVTTTTETPVKQDINQNKLGRYEFELYRYTATGSNVTLKRNNSVYIKSIEQLKKTFGLQLEDTGAFSQTPWGGISRDGYTFISELVTDDDDYGNPGSLVFGYQDVSEGDRRLCAQVDGTLFVNAGNDEVATKTDINNLSTAINNLSSRVNAMGFSEGSVTGISGATLSKMGKYAILRIPKGIIAPLTPANYTMSFTSAETVEMTIPTAADDAAATIKVTQNSNILYISGMGLRTTTLISFGFKTQ